MSDESYNGYANHETWAFNLHWQNDQGLYSETLEEARRYFSAVNDEAEDYEVGKNIVGYWREYIDNWIEETSTPLPGVLDTFDREVGSWWRIDCVEVGAAVRESLNAESM